MKNNIVHRYKNTDYYLTVDGKVYHKTSKGYKELKGTKSKNTNSISMVIHIQGKKKQVARMMWETFKGEIPPGMKVVHINGCSTMNDIGNLKLSTASIKFDRYNARKIINNSTKEVFDSMREASKKLNTSRKNIEKICNGKLNVSWYFDGKSFKGNYEKHVQRIKELNNE